MSEILARLIEQPVGPSFHFGEYRISRATTHLETLEIFQFRYRVYRESGFISPEDFPEAIFVDEFDSNSLQIAVRDSAGVLVGATRFVTPSSRGFHTQKVFEIELPNIDFKRIGEFGRLVVQIDHRGGDRLVMLGLLKAVFECMIESGTTHVLAFLPPTLAESFSRLGCKPTALISREPSSRVIENRRRMRGYFQTQNPIPVLYDLERMLDDVGVRRAVVANRLSLGLKLPASARSEDSPSKGEINQLSRVNQSTEVN